MSFQHRGALRKNVKKNTEVLDEDLQRIPQSLMDRMGRGSELFI